MSELNWLSASIGLFVISGILWLLLLLPLQRKMIRYSKESLDSGSIHKSYFKVSRLWMFYGLAATILPIIVLYLMVMKSF